MFEPAPEPARATVLHRLALLGVLALGFALRAYDLDYGMPAILHPDELSLAVPAVRIAGTFDFDPDFFNYPSLTIYALVAALLLTNALGGGAALAHDQQVLHAVLLGRWVTLLFGVATILVVYALGRRFGRRLGLLAALLLAVVPFHALDSHYLNVDVPLTFWCALSVYLLHRWWNGGALRDLVLGAASIGFAGATKYNGLVLLAVLAAGILLPLSRRVQWRSALRVAAIGGAVCVAAFLLAAPYTLLRFDDVRSALTFEAKHVLTGHWSWDVDTGHVLHRPGLYQLSIGLPFVLGFPLYLVSLGGAVAIGARRLRGWILLGVAWIALFASVGFSRVIFPRYLLPLVPFLVLAAAHGIDTVLARRDSRPWRVTGAIVLAVTLAYTTAVTATMAAALSPQAADEASAWIEQNVYPGSEIGVATTYWTLSVDGQYRFSAFDPGYARPGARVPEWFVVNSWVSRSLERSPATFPEVARFMRRLGGPDSPYERVVSFEPHYFSEELYAWLDPQLANQFESPDMTIYRRR